MDHLRAQAIAARRDQLRHYAAVYAETYGHRLNIDDLEDNDQQLADLVLGPRP